MPRLFAILFSVLGFLGAMPAVALDVPAGPVLLTVDGPIQHPNAGDSAVFDRAMLAQIDWREIESFTDFTVGKQLFAGPSLRALLSELGVQRGTLVARALDDYLVRIPIEDAELFGVILALEHNGVPLRVRNKGPIWIVYPAAVPEQINELHSARMIWQLVHITVEP